MYEQSPQDKEAALKVTIFASISLAIMTAEYLWLLRDECKYVWPRLRWHWTPWIYMSSRYLGLASQIFNLYFTLRMYSGVPTSADGCRFWFLFQAVVVQFLLACAEGLLMHRIYALFLRSRLVLFVLIVFIVGQMVSMFVSAKLSFPTNEYTATCLMTRSNPGGAFFSATTMTTNLVIFVMSFWRYMRLPAKWTQEGLGRIVLRDSGLALCAISLMMLFLTLCSLEVIKPRTSGNSTYYWLVGILWISVGRIIVNHEKVRRDSGEQSDGTWSGMLQITSQMEMGENTLIAESKLRLSIQHTRGSRAFSPSSTPSPGTPSQLSPLHSPTSPCKQKWLGDSSHLDDPRRSFRSKKPILFLDIPPTKESELSPWSDSTSDTAWQLVEDNVKIVGEAPSTETSRAPVQLPGGCADDDVLQTQDITDAWKGQYEEQGSPGPSHLELSLSNASS